MARKKKHEEHQNHEAWAIPYGDLVTLLLALFVVMYAMSSVNEGKFRVLSDSLVAAFQGSPKTVMPINIGASAKGEAPKKSKSQADQVKLTDPRMEMADKQTLAPQVQMDLMQTDNAVDEEGKTLNQIAEDVRQALQSLIDKELVVVRREQMWLEVEIKTDILFPSGVASISPGAAPILDQLATILKPFPNPVRVEGHTDNVPMRSGAFPSNWELSAARAASVVHLFTQKGMDPMRLEIIGLGEYRPIAPNTTVEGRNANRRVRIIILESAGVPETAYAADRSRAQQKPAGTEAQVPKSIDTTGETKVATPENIQANPPAPPAQTPQSQTPQPQTPRNITQ